MQHIYALLILLLTAVPVFAQELLLPDADRITITDEPVFDPPDIVLPADSGSGTNQTVLLPDPTTPRIPELPAISATPAPATPQIPAQNQTPAPANPQTPVARQTPTPAQNQTPAPANPQTPVARQTPTPAQNQTPAPATPQIPAQNQTPAPANPQTPVARQTPTPPQTPAQNQTPAPATPQIPAQNQVPASAATPQTPVQNQTPDPNALYSRTVQVRVGQMLEIPYRGTGWVYLGEARAQRGMVYDSRRLDAEGQTFLFRVNAAGTFALKFYKQDFIRDYILNDLVQVIASEPPEFSPTTWFNPPAQQSRIVAGPRWPSALEEAAAVGAVRAPAPAAPPVHPEQLSDAALDSPPSEPPEQPPEQAQDPHTYFTQAQTAFEAGDLEPALSRLDLFREHYPTGTDEAWWLYGQIFEAPGANRNIRSAVTYYQRLVQEFPWSSRISDAKKRIAYLERFYVNIQ